MRTISLVSAFTALLLLASSSQAADAFTQIHNNGFERIAANGLSSHRQYGLTQSGVSVHRGSQSPVYSPLLNRTVYRAERALVQGVRRLGDLPQASSNDVIRVRRQSYSHLERELQQGIRSQFQKITF